MSKRQEIFQAISQQVSGWRDRLARVGWRSVFSRFLRSWQAPAAVGLVAIIAVAIWAMPLRLDRLTAVDGAAAWDAANAPPRRQIVWEPAREILLTEADQFESDLITPRLTDAGGTLYFARKTTDGSADIYRARQVGGGWGASEPVEELNTPSDERGAIVTSDGRTLFFSSNRPGGQGGFDLYVTQLIASTGQWETPHNLGPQINTPANENPPAISPDGRTLVFASNRAIEMAEGLAKSQAAPQTRAQQDRTAYDLYQAARQSADSDWNEAQNLGDINLRDSNENSPSFSPNGTFLYFASDRQIASEAKTDHDLFRVRINGRKNSSVEHLGPSVNTAADDREPALSPEGFTLVFSSTRSGNSRLYLSTAIEVFEETQWDTSNLGTLKRIWSPALWVTLLIAAACAPLLIWRGWLLEKVAGARFFAASVLFHVALLAIISVWTLPKVIQIIVTKLHDAEASQQHFDDNQHQSHEDGREAWEKLADLKADKTVETIARQETEPVNIPSNAENIVPTISLARAHRLPPDRVLFVPRKKPVEVNRPQKMSSRRIARPHAAIEVAEVTQQVVPTISPEIDKIPQPAVELKRRDDVTQAAAVHQPPRFDSPKPRPLELASLQQETLPILKPSTTPPTRSTSTGNRFIVQLTEDTAAPIVPTLTGPIGTPDRIEPKDPERQISLPQRSEPPAPQPILPASTRELSPASNVARREEPKPASIESRLARPKSLRVVAAPASSVALSILVEPVEPVESTTATVKVELARNDLELSRIEAITPAVFSGPSRRLNNRLTIGNRADLRNNPLPNFGPIVSNLDRRRARASRVAYAQDNVGLREMFTLRQGDVRKQYIELFGGTDKSEAAVNQGLLWLATHQDPAGNWSLNNFHANCKGKHANCSGAGKVKSDTAATGLALLPFLAAGHTHQQGEYKKVVAAAVKWMVEHQKPDGDLLSAGDAQHMYSHGIAAIALCELYGMTEDPALKGPAQKALDFTIKSQHEPSGGWRYKPNEQADTSVVGWQMMAIKSAEMAGLSVPQKCMDNVARWLTSVEGNQPVGGQFGYVNRSPNPAMKAEGVLCLQFMGIPRNHPRMLAGADYLLKHLPQPDQKLTSYYWYYGTQVMYHMQGKYWEAWNERLREQLVKSQLTAGQMSGTWNPTDNWEASGGRVYSTALKLLILEVYYRHLPLYEQLGD